MFLALGCILSCSEPLPPPPAADTAADSDEVPSDGGAGGDGADSGEGSADNGGAGGDSAGDDGAPGDSSGWPVDWVEEPEWAPETLADELTRVLSEPLPTARQAKETYFALLDYGDTTCPGGVQLNGADPEGCTAESGYLFAGFSAWLEFENSDEFGTQSSWSLTCDLEIVSPTGERFIGGGHALEWLTYGDFGTTWTYELSGTWQHEGASGWLGEGVSAELLAEGSVQDGVLTVTLEGGLTDFGVSLYFDDVRLNVEECGGWPQGTVLVRDPCGAWYTLDLGERCDGCADLSFGGEEMGEICPDLRTAMLKLNDELTK
jgi:hypothetical protein